MLFIDALNAIKTLQYSFQVDGATVDPNVMISGLCADSRKVTVGQVFSVFSTDTSIAVQHIRQAADAGVTIMIISPDIRDVVVKDPAVHGITWLVAEKPRQLYAKLAAIIYGPVPTHRIAVTGTAGKTSVCSLVLQLWKALGIPGASIGTLGVQHTLDKSMEDVPSGLTTPDAVSLQQSLAALKSKGIDHVIMEASSHGLDQYRLDGVDFTIGAFTSFSQDHLDYHHTMEEYFEAKRRLFTDLIAPDGWSVLNSDIPEYQSLVDTCQGRHEILSFGNKGQFVKLIDMQLCDGGQNITLEINHHRYEVHFPLIGRAQVFNLMCALCCVISMGTPIQDALNVVPDIQPVPGRLTFAGQHPNGAMIFVDYAHKPQALEIVLHDMRSYCRGKLHLVFGCGGDRDQQKRPIMGKIAAEGADRVVVTDDNPRTEHPDNIRQQILQGCPMAIEIADRKLAIESAIDALEPQDVLIIAGKGHETYQIIGDQYLPFDDMDVVRSYLKHLKG